MPITAKKFSKLPGIRIVIVEVWNMEEFDMARSFLDDIGAPNGAISHYSMYAFVPRRLDLDGVMAQISSLSID